MSSDHYLILAEIEFWRDTLKTSKNSITEVELERIHQSIILVQNKLIALEITAPLTTAHEGASVAYH